MVRNTVQLFNILYFLFKGNLESGSFTYMRNSVCKYIRNSAEFRMFFKKFRVPGEVKNALPCMDTLLTGLRRDHACIGNYISLHAKYTYMATKRPGMYGATSPSMRSILTGLRRDHACKELHLPPCSLHTAVPHGRPVRGSEKNSKLKGTVSRDGFGF
jgi:hypothetical protein